MDKMTLLIFTCEKFSDLWDTHIHLLEKNWPDRGVETVLVTDEYHETHYPNVKLLAAGKNASFSARVRCACNEIQTPFVLLTLDDYFLIEPVSTERMNQLLYAMDEFGMDYLRLYDRPKRATGECLSESLSLYKIHNEERYSVNLYSGIWRTSFLLQTAIGDKSPWSFEASLSRAAVALKAFCAMDAQKDFIILDVVRKGKILNKANRYLKKHNLYHGDRPVQSIWYENMLAIRTFGVRHFPRPIVNLVRQAMMKLGRHYYSQEQCEDFNPEETGQDA